MKRKYLSQCLLLAISLVPQFAVALPGHTHGQARLDVAQEGARLEITLESPLESLVGFEHAPRNPGERQSLVTALATLRSPQSLLELPSGAACRLEQTVFGGPGVKVDGTLVDAASAPSAGAARKPRDHAHHESGHDTHADVSVSWRYSCKAPAALGVVTVRLFEAFPKLRRLDIRVVSASGQTAARMTARGRERSLVINR